MTNVTQLVQRYVDTAFMPANLRGGYGFLTDYGAIGEVEARNRIRHMAAVYGIREFHFYDWFAGYSRPTDPSGHWKDAWNSTAAPAQARDIYLETIRVYIDEIHRNHGRAWAYIQTVMADDTDLASSPGIFKNIGPADNWVFQGPFPTYFRNAALADYQCEIWAGTVHKLGFDGIHWDTLGAQAKYYEDEVAGTHEYVRRANVHLAQLGLSQILNFSGADRANTQLAWWDPALITDGTLTFPFFEESSMEHETWCYEAMQDARLVHASPFPIWGVLAFYPYYDRPQYSDGTFWSEEDVLLARWLFAPQNRLVYEAVGDGYRRLHDEYLPDNQGLSATLEGWMTYEPPPAPPTLPWQK